VHRRGDVLSLFLLGLPPWLQSFFTAYWDQGILIIDRRRIVMHYLGHWFLIDFAGSFPFDKVSPPIEFLALYLHQTPLVPLASRLLAPKDCR
jgi:hypothetical protein